MTTGSSIGRISTPEFDTFESSPERNCYSDFTDQYYHVEQDVKQAKSDSPLSDLTLPATFNEQTFEPPEHLEMNQATLTSEAEYREIVTDYPKHSFRHSVSNDLEALINALDVKVTKAINSIKTCTDFEFPYTLKSEEIKV